jgi:hypothetical protein
MTDSTGPDGDARELRESRELFRLIIESFRDFAIYTTDLERRALTWIVSGGDPTTDFAFPRSPTARPGRILSRSRSPSR